MSQSVTRYLYGPFLHWQVGAKVPLVYLYLKVVVADLKVTVQTSATKPISLQ